MRDSKEVMDDFMTNLKDGKFGVERKKDTSHFEMTQQFVEEKIEDFEKTLSLKIVKNVLNKGEMK